MHEIKDNNKRREGAIAEMEKLLMIWMESRIQKRVPLSLMMIQSKAYRPC
jgi:hypothetical protein